VPRECTITVQRVEILVLVVAQVAIDVTCPPFSTESTTRVSSSRRKPMGKPRFMVKVHSSDMDRESNSFKAACLEGSEGCGSEKRVKVGRGDNA